MVEVTGAPHELVRSILRQRPPDQSLRWVGRCIGPGSRITMVRPLSGGTSHANHALNVIDRRDFTHRLVLRRWARPGWESTDPGFTAQREVAALTMLAHSNLPAPALVATDEEGKECDVPAILMSRLPGQQGPAPADMDSFLTQLAEGALRIHVIDGRARELIPPYRPYYSLTQVRPPAWSVRPRLWEKALEFVSGSTPAGRQCFIHRDYHPGNTLWAQGRLVGIVDWASASWGSPGVDLGHMRWNLALGFGIDAAEEFLASYESLKPETDHHPYWDLRTALDLIPDLDPQRLPPADALERFETHVATALSRGGGSIG